MVPAVEPVGWPEFPQTGYFPLVRKGLGEIRPWMTNGTACGGPGT